MLKTRIIYIIAVIAAALFALFHNHAVAYITFFSLLIIPLVSFILFRLALQKVNMAVVSPSDIGEKGRSIYITILVRNMAKYPFAMIKMQCSYGNRTYGGREDFIVSTGAFPQNISRVRCRVLPAYRGEVFFILKTACFYDLLGLFKYRYKTNKGKKVLVLPQRSIEKSLIDSSTVFENDEKFSLTKSGDDISEVFRTREYLQGDPMKAIHWKLSSRTDQLMVRQFSQPVNNSVMILMDLQKHWTNERMNFAAVDGVLETAIALIVKLLQLSISCTLLFYNVKIGGIDSYQINSLYEFEQAVLSLTVLPPFVHGTNIRDLLRLQQGQKTDVNNFYMVVSKIDAPLEETTIDFHSNQDTKLHVLYYDVENDAQTNKHIKKLSNSGMQIRMIRPKSPQQAAAQQHTKAEETAVNEQ